MSSREWRRKSWAVKQYQDFHCHGCGKLTTLQTHHIHYATVGMERPCDVVALCRDCHVDIHGQGPKSNPKIKLPMKLAEVLC